MQKKTASPPSPNKVYQGPRDVAPNPIGFPQEDAEKIVHAFNRELAATYVLYHQVKKHHWLVRGPEWHDVHLLLDEKAEELLEQADFFAERITYFGGVPLATMSGFEEESYVKPEGEGLMDLRRMLANDVVATTATLQSLRELHEGVLDEAKDIYDASQIEEFVGRREKFCHEMHYFLEPDDLERSQPEKEVLNIGNDLAADASK